MTQSNGWNKKGILDATLDIINQMMSINPIEPLTGSPSFKKIDIWNNQLKNEKDGTGYTFPTPAIFLEMKQNKSKQLSMGINLVDYDVIFHIIDTQLNNLGYLDRNTKVFSLRNYTKKQFQLYQPVQMGRLFCIKDEQDFKHDNVYHYKLTFKGALIDTWGNNLPISGSVSNTNIIVVYNIGVGYDEIGYSLIVYNP